MKKKTLALLFTVILFVSLTTTAPAQTTPQGTTIDNTTVTVVSPSGNTIEIDGPDRLITVEWSVVNKPEKAGGVFVSLEKIENGEVFSTKNLIRYQGDPLTSLSGSADFFVPYSVVSGEYRIVVMLDRSHCINLNYALNGTVVLDTPCATTDHSDSVFTLVSASKPIFNEKEAVIVTDISPTSVRPGELVTISGENFGSYSDVWVAYADNSFWSTAVRNIKNINNTLTFNFPDYLDTHYDVADINDISGVTYPIKDGNYIIRVRNRDNLYTGYTQKQQPEITSGLFPKITIITTPDRNEVSYALVGDLIYIYGLELCKESDNTIIFSSYDDPSIYTISEHVATLSALSSWNTGDLPYNIPSSIQTHNANGEITGTIPVTPGRYNVSITKKLGDLMYESDTVTISITDTVFTVSSLSQSEGGPGEEIIIYGENFGSNNSIWLEQKPNSLICKIFTPTEQTGDFLTINIPETIDHVGEKSDVPYKTEPMITGEYTIKVVDETTKITSKKFDFTVTNAATPEEVTKKEEIPFPTESVKVPIIETIEVPEPAIQIVETPATETVEVQEPSTQENDLEEDKSLPVQIPVKTTTKDEDLNTATKPLIEPEPEKTKEEEEVVTKPVLEKPTPKEEENDSDIVTKQKAENTIVIKLSTKGKERVYKVIINMVSFFSNFLEKN